jgi:signal transduction histidine kinase
MNLRHAPLRVKLRFVILTTCTAALLIACASLFAVQFYFFRKEHMREFAAWTAMIAKASSAATDFNDSERAEQVLALLGEKAQHVRAALIRRAHPQEDPADAKTPEADGAKTPEPDGAKPGPDGAKPAEPNAAKPPDPEPANAKPKPALTPAQVRLGGVDFARWEVADFDFSQFDAPEEPTSWRMNGDVIFAQPIFGKEKDRVGTLFVVSDYATPANALIRLYLTIFCIVALSSMLIGMLISTRLAHLITGPLEHLASTVKKIAGSNDYSLRAEKNAEDEVGAFTDSFNQMLGRIQGRDADLRHEIAERERAEKELQQLHQQLLDASRQAGMAEVATGVLHNVGNVLNSVNVSATIVAEKLNVHRLNNLVRTADLMREQDGNVGEFLTRDPKGQLIPGYLSDLSKHLVTERQEALAELELLTKNIEHIKEIVSMQQNYARVAGVIEQLPPESLVEDALRMTISSLQRHHIDVVRDYEHGCPTVTVERHKTLQILVNLIRNSKHAMDDASPPSKLLTLRIRKSAAGFAVITIVDNGIGISAKNLTKIFQHGFTTRKDGHGFGLHSAALAAQQMGGRLTAHSDGPGRGAAFTLELPLAKKEEVAA